MLAAWAEARPPPPPLPLLLPLPVGMLVALEAETDGAGGGAGDTSSDADGLGADGEAGTPSSPDSLSARSAFSCAHKDREGSLSCPSPMSNIVFQNLQV